jgi:hypothetical protein
MSMFLLINFSYSETEKHKIYHFKGDFESSATIYFELSILILGVNQNINHAIEIFVNFQPNTILNGWLSIWIIIVMLCGLPLLINKEEEM